MVRKTVKVRKYKRYRLGQWEEVCTHFRRWPRS